MIKTDKDYVFRDPSVKDQDKKPYIEAWRVMHEGEIQTAVFNAKGPAMAYLAALQRKALQEIKSEVPTT